MATIQRMHPGDAINRPLGEEVKQLGGPSADVYGYSHLMKPLLGSDLAQRTAAVKALRNRKEVLIELANFSTFGDVRISAIEFLDEDALADIAKYCHFDDARSKALDSLRNNTALLKEIACSALFKEMRVSSVSMLEKDGLIEVAASSPKPDSRMAALERLSGDALALLQVVESSPYKKIRAEAVKRMASDLDALCKTLKSSKHRDAKKAAIEILRRSIEMLDEDALVELARLSQDAEVRYLAVSNLSGNQRALRRAIRESRYGDVKRTALMLLSYSVSRIEDTATLVDIACLSQHKDCRRVAIEKIAEDTKALLEVALSSRFSDTRTVALMKIESLDAIRTIRKSSKYRDTRQKADRILVSSAEKTLSALL